MVKDATKRSSDDTTHTRIKRNSLEGLKLLCVKKYGQVDGYLSIEVSRAVEEYIHLHRPEVEQQQQMKVAAVLERTDVEANMFAIQNTLHNDRGVASRMSGAELFGAIRNVLKKEGRKGDRRTVKSYTLRLLDKRVLKYVPGTGRLFQFKNEWYEII